MANRRSTGRVAATYLLLAGLQRGVSLLILPFISHVMSPDQYGAASTLTASTLLLVTLAAAPLEQLVFRATARGGEDAPAVLRATGFYCYLVLPGIVAVVALVVALAMPSLFGASGQIWGLALLAVGFQPAATYFALPLVRAQQDLTRFVILASTSIFTLAASKVVLIVIYRLGVLGWILSDLFAAVVSAILAAILVRPPRARVSRRHIRTIASFAVPLIPHRASFWALSSLSRPAMATVSTLTQVGLLSFGLNLAAVANMVLAEFNQAVLPRYSRETFPSPTEETHSPVRWQLALAFVVPSFIGACLAVGGKWMFAQPYWPSFALTGVLLGAQVAYGLYLIPMNYIVQTAGLPKYSGIASVSGALLILIGIFVFGRQFGALGVAYSTSIGFLVMAVVAVVLTRALHLRIRWQEWAASRWEITAAVAGFGCSFTGLFCPVGSAQAYGFSAAGVTMCFIAVAALSRNTRTGRTTSAGIVDAGGVTT